MTQTQVLQNINDNIFANGLRTITGTVLNGVLNNMFQNAQYNELAISYTPTDGSSVVAASDSIFTAISKLQGQLNNTVILKTGGIMTGLLTLSADPTNSMHAANKNYVDQRTNGLAWKRSVRFATTAAFSPTFNSNGTDLTSSSNGVFPVIDGVTAVLGDTFLLKNETSTKQQSHGAFIITSMGSAGTPWTASRCEDSYTGAMLQAATWRVREGTVEGNRVYAVNNPTLVINTTSITFAQVAGPGTYSNGTYLTLSANVFDINFAAFSTTQITEGSKLFYTDTRARAAIITGFSSGAGTVSATDTILAALGKLDGNIATHWDGSNIVLPLASRIIFKSGLNMPTGTLTLSGGAATVNISWLNATNDNVIVSRKTISGTAGNLTWAISGTTLTITSSAGGADAGQVNYFITSKV